MRQNILDWKCFLELFQAVTDLVGSGPSSELAYPSWKRLAEAVAAHVISGGNTTTAASAYDACLQSRQYPELFQQAEYDGGGRRALVQTLKTLLRPGRDRPGPIYEFLARWPFACYLTTNWDDEVYEHIVRLGEHYATVQNTLDDLHHIRDGVSHLIVKLHSDLDHPSDAVITSRDYKRLGTDKEGEYFRSKLRAIFDLFDVLVVGHSLADPDLRIVLQTAQQSANPNRPIYMISADATTIDVREFFQNYNIVLIPYPNPDGTHGQLRRILSIADRFILSRGNRFDLPPIDAEERDAAVSLLIFRRLQKVQCDPSWNTGEYLGPLILQAVGTATVPIGAAEDLLSFRPFQSMVFSSDKAAVSSALNEASHELMDHGLLESTFPLHCTDAGRALLFEVQSDREFIRMQAYAQFASRIRRSYQDAGDADLERAQQVFENSLVEAFRRRGLAIANAVFGDQTATADDLSALFAAISQAVSYIESPYMQFAFVESAHEFLTSPTAPQQSYLAALSQGFFLYHMLGYDASCARIRHDVFNTTAWFCDSSILIPLVAIGCHNHEFAVDLFNRLHMKGGRNFVTRRMCREVWQHLEWAIRFVRDNSAVNSTFLSAALVKPGYKQNLFLDGFIRTSAEGRASTFDDYLSLVCGDTVSFSSMMERLVAAGVRVTDMSLVEGFEQDDWAQVQELADLIKDDRALHLIYRSDDQVYAEAEVLFIIRQLRSRGYRLSSAVERAYFVSESHVLNRVAGTDYVTTWAPEVLYQYLTSLPGKTADPSLFKECLLHEFYLAGVSIIDKPRYLRFFGPSINESRIAFAEQKQQYVADMETGVSLAMLEADFEATPDLEKPLFVQRLALRSIEVAQALARDATVRATDAERRVKVLEDEKAQKWRSSDRARARQMVAEERNRADPKHIRKRERQRKRRSRRK